MLFKTTNRNRPPSITNGRTLFNCAPDQFLKTYHSDEPPREGLIKNAMMRMSLKTHMNAAQLWTVQDLEGVPQCSMQRTERRALTAWWSEQGKILVKEIRERDREWVEMPGPGRRWHGLALSERQAMRSESFITIYNICKEAVDLLEQHCPVASGWIKFASKPDTLRHNSLRQVGERRITVEMCAALYDLHNVWPSYVDALDGIAPFDHDKANAEVAVWVHKLTLSVNGAYLLPLLAVNLAMTEMADPRNLIVPMMDVVNKHHVSNRIELLRMCETTLS